jgi:hypothetical protein
MSYKINVYFTIEDINASFNFLEKNKIGSTFTVDFMKGVKKELSDLEYLLRWSLNRNMNYSNGVNILTNSPLVICYINNMLYAFKKGNKASDEIKSKISKIVPKNNWIDPDNFSAHEIKNGKEKNIFNRKTGLIKEVSIDIISIKIIEDFREMAMCTITP